MKKLLGSTLTNISSTASAVSAAASQQLNRTLGDRPPGVPAAAGPSSSPTPPSSSDKQYLRLPVESARKLRWFDKEDLSALTKQHMREKHQLLDTITALKTIMIRAGFTDASLDAQTRQLLSNSDNTREADAGVEQVLLLALQAELDELREQLDMEKAKAAFSDAGSASTNAAAASGQESTGAQAEAAAQAVPNREAAGLDATLVAGLQQSLEAFDRCSAAAAQLQRKVRSQEQELASLEAEETLRMLLRQQRQQEQHRQQQEELEGSSDQEGPATPRAGLEASTSVLRRELASEREQLAALAAKLQRAEAQRRAQADEVHGLVSALAAAKQEAADVRGLLAAAEQRAAALSEEAERRQQEFAKLQQQVQASGQQQQQQLQQQQQQQQRQAGQSAQQQADVLRRYKDLALQMEERALDAERKRALAEARIHNLEGSLREAQDELQSSQRDAQRSAAASGKEISALEGRLRAAEAAAADAERRAADGGGAGAVKAVERLSQLEEEQRGLQRELAAARTQVTNLERRLAASEQREAQLMADARESEGVAAEAEELAAQVAALRARLAESRGERGQLESYKKVAHELEEAKARLEEELIATARIVTQLETKLRAAQARGYAAEEAAELAHARAQAAEASITAEVEARMAAVGSNRALWPAAAREEVERAEEKAEALAGALTAVRGELEASTRIYQEEARLKSEQQRRVMEVEDRLVRTERELSSRIRDLESTLDSAQKDADAVREVAQKLEAERDDARAAAAAVGTPNGTRMARRGSMGSAASLSSMDNGVLGGNGKWQVQNIVGGGALYDIKESNGYTSAGSSNGGSAPSAHPSDRVHGVDLVYLRNVVLKFLEAVAAGRSSERDALLPAIAALLQASPKEFAAMQRVLANTAPAGTQVLAAGTNVLSVLGWG